MAIKVGYECKLFYSIGGVAANDWHELTNAQDVTLSLEKGEADVTTRGNNGYTAKKATLKDASIEFTAIWDSEDAGLSALKDSFFNDQLIGIAALDGDIDSGEGLVADMEVFTFGRNEPLKDGVTIPIKLQPTYSASPPEWVENGVGS